MTLHRAMYRARTTSYGQQPVRERYTERHYSRGRDSAERVCGGNGQEQGVAADDSGMSVLLKWERSAAILAVGRGVEYIEFVVMLMGLGFNN